MHAASLVPGRRWVVAFEWISFSAGGSCRATRTYPLLWRDLLVEPLGGSCPLRAGVTAWVRLSRINAREMQRVQNDYGSLQTRLLH
jgi:hypothetical protein